MSGSSIADFTLTLERTAKGGNIRILRGQDDGSPFAVQVPARCKTIEQAIEWLRPAEVPADAPRQGDLFFVPQPRDFKPSMLAESEYTPAGSYREVTVYHGPQALGNHRFDGIAGDTEHKYGVTRVVQAAGDTMFVGRRKVKSHSWQGRPRYFVRGIVSHPEHTAIDLGMLWHEVIRNRAAGPWPVSGIYGGD